MGIDGHHRLLVSYACHLLCLEALGNLLASRDDVLTASDAELGAEDANGAVLGDVGTAGDAELGTQHDDVTTGGDVLAAGNPGLGAQRDDIAATDVAIQRASCQRGPTSSQQECAGKQHRQPSSLHRTLRTACAQHRTLLRTTFTCAARCGAFSSCAGASAPTTRSARCLDTHRTPTRSGVTADATLRSVSTVVDPSDANGVCVLESLRWWTPLPRHSECSCANSASPPV